MWKPLSGRSVGVHDGKPVLFRLTWSWNSQYPSRASASPHVTFWSAHFTCLGLLAGLLAGGCESKVTHQSVAAVPPPPTACALTRAGSARVPLVRMNAETRTTGLSITHPPHEPPKNFPHSWASDPTTQMI